MQEQDIDDIISKINWLRVDESNSLNSDQKVIETMTTPTDIALLRYQADNIPLFDGNPKQLNRFIASSENMLKNFQKPSVPADPINSCLLDTILNKLRGRAADLICSRSELNSWDKIKQTLILSFSDHRGIDCLIQDLINMKPVRNETPLQFGLRIQDTRSLLFAKLNATISDANEALVQTKHYDSFALKTYINGLPYNLQLVVRLRNPTSLEQAMSFVTEEENFKNFSNPQNFTFNANRQQNSKPVQNYQKPQINVNSAPAA